MAIDIREDGDWCVSTDKSGNIVQELIGTSFKIVTAPENINSLPDEGARSAAQIQMALNGYKKEGPY